VVNGSSADRITVLHYGEILADGRRAEIQQNPRVLEVLSQDMERRAAPDDPLINGRDLHILRQDHILHGVSLRSATARWVGLLGRNGVAQEHHAQDHHGPGTPRQGKVMLGKGADHQPAGAQARQRWGSLRPEDRRIFGC